MSEPEEGVFKNVIDRVMMDCFISPLYTALCNSNWYEVDEAISVSSNEVKPRIEAFNILDEPFKAFLARMRSSEKPGLDRALNILHLEELSLAWNNYCDHLNTKDPKFINAHGIMTCGWIGLEKKLLDTLSDSMCTYWRYAGEGTMNKDDKDILATEADEVGKDWLINELAEIRERDEKLCHEISVFLEDVEKRRQAKYKRQ